MPILYEDAASAAIEAFVLDHPHLARHIRKLAKEFLRRGIGLRDGRNGASKTNDLSFVNRQHCFASLTAEPGKYDRATENRLQVQVRYQSGGTLRVFELKSRPSEAARGWHEAQLAAGDDIAPLLEDLSTVFA